MIKETFIPNWYLDEKNKIKNKKIKIISMIILIINIFLLSCILNISNNTKDRDTNTYNVNNKISEKKNVKRDIVIIEKYKELSDFLSKNNLSYKNIILTKDNLEIDIEIKSYEEFNDAIRSIENHYSIIKLTPNIKNEGKFNFKVILEV
ncbi:MAG TPA: hypothetical protein VIM70_19815 [Clostridium sp.]|uniref:hypothetical protein n=1 Tax=Clostridium sp. TaxID=1506 RepID=UPI002F954382